MALHTEGRLRAAFAARFHHHAELHGGRIELTMEGRPRFCRSLQHVARIGSDVQRKSGGVKHSGVREFQIATQWIDSFGLHAFLQLHISWIARRITRHSSYKF